MSTQPTVLVVDDEPDIRRAYAEFLTDQYDVRTAASGTEALEHMDDDVAAVLLDRRMPDMSGDEVLARIREADYDCRVAMVTAVDPDFDIIELGFDDYVVKPVRPTDLHNVVDSLLYWSEYDAIVREYLSTAATVATLEAEKSAHELENHAAYAELTDRLDELTAEAEDALDESIEDGEFETLLRNVDL